jgi:hypothetical protein
MLPNQLPSHGQGGRHGVHPEQVVRHVLIESHVVRAEDHGRAVVTQIQHGAGDHVGIYRVEAGQRFVKSKELLRQADCGDKPVWSAEIYCGFPIMEPLVLPNWTLQAWPTPSRSREYLGVLKNPRHPKFAEINAWYRGMQAAQVVKICMVALHAGSRKLMVGWAVDAQNPLAVSTFSHHGLYSMTFKRLWPAAYTYDLVIKKLAGMKRIERLNRPENANAFVYRCTLNDERLVWVAFCDDHIGQNHDQPTASVLATVPVGRQRLRVTHSITEIGQTKPKVVQTQAKRGQLQLRLTEYPVFIEADEPSD